MMLLLLWDLEEWAKWHPVTVVVILLEGYKHNASV